MKYLVKTIGKKDKRFLDFNMAIRYCHEIENPKQSEFIFILEEDDLKRIEDTLDKTVDS